MSVYDRIKAVIDESAYLSQVDAYQLISYIESCAKAGNRVIDDLDDADLFDLSNEFLDKEEEALAPLYRGIKPKEHSALPSSIFTLPIANSITKGHSLECIDQKPFQKLAKSVGLRIVNPKLRGVVLCPKTDMLFLITILQKLLPLTPDYFKLYGPNSEILNEGKIVEIDYYDILDETQISLFKKSYNKKNFSRKDVLEEFRESMDRIAILGLSYYTQDGKQIMGQHFFDSLHFNVEKRKLYVRPTWILRKLFRHDRILTLNQELLNVPKSGIELTTLIYLSSLPFFYSTKSNVPFVLKKRVTAQELAERCWPVQEGMSKEEFRVFYKTKRALVVNAMNALKKINFISFTEGLDINKHKVFDFIEVRIGLKTEDFTKNYLPELTPPGENIRSYLKAYPLPASKKADVWSVYVGKHFEKMVAIAGWSNESIKAAFSTVSTHTVKTLKKKAEIFEHKEMTTLIDKLSTLRTRGGSNKKKKEVEAVST